MAHAAKTNKIGFGLILILALGLAACHKDEAYFGNTTTPAGQTLVFNNRDEPNSLDPALGDSSSALNIIYSLFEGLVQNDPVNTRPMAALATHYETSADGTEYRFYLRGHPDPRGARLPDTDSLPFEYSHGTHPPPDAVPARWSDGTTITARDFVYAWRRAVDPQTAAPLREYLSVLKNGAVILKGKRPPEDLGVSAPDDFTVRVELQEPAPYLLPMAATNLLRAVPRHVVEKARRAGHPESWTQPGVMVTSGPFVLSQWRPYEAIKLRRSTTYCQADLVRLEEITFLPISADATVTNLYRAGITQATNPFALPAALFPALRSKKDFHTASNLGFTAYSINVYRPPLDNVLIRYALNMALDKNALARYLDQTPARNLASPVAGYTGPQTVSVSVRGRSYNILQYNPVAAQALLAEAGYPDGTGKDGRQLAFDLRVWSSPTDLNLAQILSQQWLENLHIHARLIPTEKNVAVTDMRAGNFSGMTTDSLSSDFADPFGVLSPTNVTDFSGGWTNPVYVSLLTQANHSLDPADRLAKLARAEEQLLRDMPILPLAFVKTHYLRKPYVRALAPDPLSMHYFRYTWIDHNWNQGGKP